MSTFKRVVGVIGDLFVMADMEVSRETTLAEDFGFDEIDHYALVMAIEDEFDIKVDEAEAESWATVGDVVRYVNRALRGGGGA